jgi:N-acetylglutamate synthase-like GNAT family acetyltransferase
MHLPLPLESAAQSTAVKLVPISTEKDWSKLLTIRRDIEYTEYNITAPRAISLMIDNIKDMSQRLNAQWYIAHCGLTPVGAIGLVMFEHQSKRFGRLQDVDIIQSQRNKGYGTAMLHAIISISVQNKLESLYLRADENDWKKDWYKRLGFQPIEVWTPQ